MPTQAHTTQLDLAPLRDVIGELSSLPDITDRMAKNAFMVGPDDLMPLVLCGHAIRAKSNNYNYSVEGTCAWYYIAHSLRSEGLIRAADIFIDDTELMQRLLRGSGDRNLDKLAVAATLRRIEALAEAERAIDKIVCHFREWAAVVVAFWDRKDLSELMMPEGTGSIEKAGDVVAHFCNGPVCAFMGVFREAFGSAYSRLDQKWEKHHNPRKEENG